VARIAIAAGVPVIPAGITGTDLALPRGARLPRPRAVHIAFGPPIMLSAPEEASGAQPAGAADNRAATDQIMAAIAALSGQRISASI